MKNRVYTFSDDKKNLGYSSTVKAAAFQLDLTYNELNRHCGITFTSENEYREIIEKITKSIETDFLLGYNVCIIFAGGDNWNSKISILQKELEKIIDKDKVIYILITERFNENDNFEEIKSNLNIISQEEIPVKLIKTIKSNIKLWKVDISAASNKEKMKESGNIFYESNKDILKKSGFLDIRPIASINYENILLKYIFKMCNFNKLSTRNYFYMGGRGEGFSEENGIHTINEFKSFFDKSLQMNENSKYLVFFLHQLRSFTKLDGTNYFLPINQFYKYIKSKLKDNQICYVFSQKIVIENEKETRQPVLYKIKNYEEEKFDLINNGSSYTYSLIQAKKTSKIIVASQEQQNFPSDALAIGVEPDKIKSIEWNFENKKIHSILYEKIIKKGKTIKSTSNIIKYVIKGENFDFNYNK